MELFRCVRKGYQMIGMYPNQSSGTRCAFNLKNLFILINLVQMFTSSMAFFLFKAENIGDRADSFFMSTTYFLCFCIVPVTIWKLPPIFELFGKFEKFIDARKLNLVAKIRLRFFFNKI